MYLKRKRMSRRRVLQGAGAALALPLLDLMQTTVASTAAQQPPKRAAFFYVPNGVVQSAWHPTETGEGFALSPTLEPLGNVREKISLYTHLDRVKVAGTDGHAQASTCWLSSAAPDELSPAGYPLKKTLDQIMASVTGQHTAFRSLELSCNPYQDNRESVYFDNISWYGHGHLAQSMRDPEQVFKRLFNVEEQAGQGSILDLVLEDAQSLQQQLGRQDLRKLGEYMESVRTVEQQIQRIRARQTAVQNRGLSLPEEHWTTMRRDEYIQIMGDLMILALRTDLTRVASLMVAPERWGTPLLVHDLFKDPIVHHSMTHGQGNENVRRDLEKLDRYHVQQFAHLVSKMDSIEDGEGSLLDHSMFVFGSGLSSGRTHVYSNLPIVIAGSAHGSIRLNQHHQSLPGTPVANLWLALARSMGVPGERYGDSTGAISLS